MAEEKKTSNVENIKQLGQIVSSGDLVGISKKAKELKRETAELLNELKKQIAQFKTEKKEETAPVEKKVEKAEEVVVKAEPVQEVIKEEVVEQVPVSEPKPAPVQVHIPSQAEKDAIQRAIERDRRWKQQSSQEQNANGNKTTARRFDNKNGDNRPPRQGQKPQGQGVNQNSQNKKPVKLAAEPAFIPQQPGRNVGNKKKDNKSSDGESKKTMNKRTLIKRGFIVEDEGDYDERMGSHKIRPRKNKESNQVVKAAPIKIEKAVVTSDIIPIKTLSEKIGVTAAEITKKLFNEGQMKTINDSIDFTLAEYISMEFGVTLEYQPETTAEETLLKEEVDDEKDLVPRPPVVTVMGHVDHGKTSLLDAIKHTQVTSTEAGGITQHIGAYSVEINKRKITFIDTPGHEAFTAMRMRGAQITDVAILVVAADDGVMPQTIEAINHIKAAGVELIVAINKMDKPTANKDRILQQLVEYEILSEEWGGNVITVPVSAKTGQGVNELLESVLTVADVLELKANPNRKASGIVVEAQLDKGKGPMATILVQNGTLKVGDSVISGTATGKIRAMIDDKGRNITSAGPSQAVSVLGLSEVPEAGDRIIAVSDDKLSRAVLEERMKKQREDMIKNQGSMSLEEIAKKLKEGELKGLNLIIKADVQGSYEAVKQSVLKLSNDEVSVKVIHGGVGAINESDVMLASTSQAIIIGFNVRPDAKTKAMAEKEHVDIKTYRIIYDAIDDISAALKGMLAPKFKEVFLGSIEVRDVFKISGVGAIAGGYVIEGKIIRNSKAKLLRQGVIVHEGNISSLKRFKDDVKEVAQGFECGIGLEGYNDIKVGDVIEVSIMEEQKEA